MKRLLKIIAIGWIVGLVIWSIYLTHLAIEVIPGWFRVAEQPVEFVRPEQYVWEKGEDPQFKVGIELPETEFRVGEPIHIRPYIINMGEQPITIYTGHRFLFFRVYDAENRPVGPGPETIIGMAIHTLRPGIPVHTGPYTFILEEPGRYRIEPWANFSFYRVLNGVHTRSPSCGLVHAEPAWIEVRF